MNTPLRAVIDWNLVILSLSITTTTCFFKCQLNSLVLQCISWMTEAMWSTLEGDYREKYDGHITTSIDVSVPYSRVFYSLLAQTQHIPFSTTTACIPLTCLANTTSWSTSSSGLLIFFDVRNSSISNTTRRRSPRRSGWTPLAISLWVKQPSILLFSSNLFLIFLVLQDRVPLEDMLNDPSPNTTTILLLCRDMFGLPSCLSLGAMSGSGPGSLRTGLR